MFTRSLTPIGTVPVCSISAIGLVSFESDVPAEGWYRRRNSSTHFVSARNGAAIEIVRNVASHNFLMFIRNSEKRCETGKITQLRVANLELRVETAGLAIGTQLAIR